MLNLRRGPLDVTGAHVIIVLAADGHGVSPGRCPSITLVASVDAGLPIRIDPSAACVQRRAAKNTQHNGEIGRAHV
jgi:hypothetical protein